MARQGISKEKIWETARALEGAGRRVTVSGIRERLGTGSFTTIQAALAEYRDQAIEAVEAAPEMPDAVRVLSEQVWAACWAEFERQHSEERAAVAERAEKIEEEKAELLQEVRRLEELYETEVNNTAQVLQELTAERESRARVEGKLDSLERQVRQTIEAKDAEIARLMELVTRHADALEAAEHRPPAASPKKKAAPAKKKTVKVV